MNPTAKARMRQVFPGSDVPDWLRYSEKQRQNFAEIEMIWARGNGATEDDTAFQEFGYDGTAEYWQDILAEPMKASAFIMLLIKHLKNFRDKGPGRHACSNRLSTWLKIWVNNGSLMDRETKLSWSGT